MHTLFSIMTAASLAVGVQAAPLTWAPSSVVVLTLRPAVAVNGTQAVVQDVASLEGGTLLVRQRIGALDLVDIPANTGEVTVSCRQITFRLLLAGFQAHQFRVEGPASIRISWGSMPSITRVSAETTGSMPRGDPNRREDSPAPRLLQENLVGAKETPQILVKCRDVVHMVTYVGELKVVTTGEALEDGRAGQLIRLRNVESSRMVRGRVIDRAIVEVEFARSKP